ncbi:uncharacterized protein PHACADRAFT_154199 [Phanerochaete carnosa HHB-10118-sp]|uniref:F-box domain-containing protein n=1 Tax=Phanerochaete carnosa (strain HHB-10118-sp) TaxID=650164 RepID=K5UJE8_PHACS|nr:uncharacterized protein PHACADRAFT_154199 [Phanerochaete carnosa HHB-10118-sp]EKM49691.1 hypothetical protein PHACADRAFT_154199 [Phanerochaete carnosa HHB-10118-sp]
MPTAIQTLPEELLREILSYCFHLSPDAFCSSRSRWHSLARPSAYDKKEKRTCQDLLLVCKYWLRLATPLLYTSVAIRTPAHAAAVAALLKATPGLGRALRQLKVFGGYGRDMATIAGASPNVETLYVYVSVKSNESTTGIKKALCALSPKRLFLEDRRVYRNKKVEELRKLVDEQIATWPRLVSRYPVILSFTLLLTSPQREVHYSPTYPTQNPATIVALRRSTSVRELWLDASAIEHMLGNDVQSVRTLMQDAALEKLYCLGKPLFSSTDARKRMVDAQYPQAILDAIVFEEYPDKDGLPALPPPATTPWALDDDDDDDYFWPANIDSDEEDLMLDEEEELMGLAATSTTTAMLLMAMFMAMR